MADEREATQQEQKPDEYLFIPAFGWYKAVGGVTDEAVGGMYGKPHLVEYVWNGPTGVSHRYAAPGGVMIQDAVPLDWAGGDVPVKHE